MEQDDLDPATRYRSSSFSSELRVASDNHKNFGNHKIIREISIEFKCTVDRKTKGILSAEKARQMIPQEEYNTSMNSAREAWNTNPDHFPFDSLPQRLQIAVLKFLFPSDRGLVGSVSKKWRSLVRSSSLWTYIDLKTFPPCRQNTDNDDDDYDESVESYQKYQKRTRSYINFLITIRPEIHIFRFAFDLADLKDGWLEGIDLLLRSSFLQKIIEADLTWNETLAKPSILDSASLTWSTSDYKDLMYKHRHRQRYFLKFFDLFTTLAVSLRKLTVPFDWTERSIRSLSRLFNLKYLILVKYFIFQNLEQCQIDSLLSSAPNITHLTFEIWTPSGRGLQSIKFKSESLISLNISQCRGIKLDKDLYLPNLKKLWVYVTPMKGPISGQGGTEGEGVKKFTGAHDTDEEEVGVDATYYPGCLFNILKTGAPKLVWFNGLKLMENWKNGECEEMENILKKVCVCKKHITAARTDLKEEE